MKCQPGVQYSAKERQEAYACQSQLGSAYRVIKQERSGDTADSVQCWTEPYLIRPVQTLLLPGTLCIHHRAAVRD